MKIYQIRYVIYNNIGLNKMSKCRLIIFSTFLYYSIFIIIMYIILYMTITMKITLRSIQRHLD